MPDRFTSLAQHPLTGRLIRALGLPNPPALVRARGGWEARPLSDRVAVLGAAPGAFATPALRSALSEAGADVRDAAPAGTGSVHAAVFDGTGLADPAALSALYEFFHPIVPKLAPGGRVLLLAGRPEGASTPAAAAAARAVEGFVRSLAKEIGRRGATANLVYVAAGAEERLAAPVRFLCGTPSTYVTGQALRVAAAVRAPASIPWEAALRGKVALVTGAARGIGAATAVRLAMEGARVVCLDVPGVGEALEATARRSGGEALAVDVAAPTAPGEVVSALKERYGGVDVVVHNAGVTRDRTLAKMAPEQWDQVFAVNLRAIVALDDALLGAGALRDEGRLVYLSSVAGVAGNFGQTNYAATKAGLIGYVAALAPRLAPRGACANAVAPGFIETAMVAKMPFLTRELGRRLNSLLQGGDPRDVAEVVTFLASPGASGVSGETVRVCGQALIGA